MSEPNSEGQVRLHARVEGRVQGVGFRYFVQETANSLFINGWVRNRWDGSVEVMAEGERHDLEKLLLSLQRGPHPYTTTNVIPEWSAATGEFQSFRLRQTD